MKVKNMKNTQVLTKTDWEKLNYDVPPMTKQVILGEYKGRKVKKLKSKWYYWLLMPFILLIDLIVVPIVLLPIYWMSFIGEKNKYLPLLKKNSKNKSITLPLMKMGLVMFGGNDAYNGDLPDFDLINEVFSTDKMYNSKVVKAEDKPKVEPKSAN